MIIVRVELDNGCQCQALPGARRHSDGTRPSRILVFSQPSREAEGGRGSCHTPRGVASGPLSLCLNGGHRKREVCPGEKTEAL